MSSAAPKRILIIGMLDSVHLARWLDQFRDTNNSFTIFPSKRHRKMHFQLRNLVVSEGSSSFTFLVPNFLLAIEGYLDFFQHEFLRIGNRERSRARKLQRVIKHGHFDIIHACEIQGAGYLMNLIDISHTRAKIILTNWGSDIYFYGKFPKHRDRIINLLKKVHYYSAECERDYRLAADLGFNGNFLPCIPNAGGFDLGNLNHDFGNPSSRIQILIKGYGGEFGRADLPVKLIPHIARARPNVFFHIYSATPDTVALVDKFPFDLRARIKLSTISRKLSHKDILLEFCKSRIYVGCSQSDGISTSFLEALVCGAYPIQTDTSCANEWIAKGVIASIVPLDSRTILREILKGLDQDELVDFASEKNKEVANTHLSKLAIRKIALQFYAI